MAWPLSNRWVANEWRTVWPVAGVMIPEARTARRTAFLNQGGIEMVAALLSCHSVVPAPLLREHPLPAPFAFSVGVFATQGVGHQHPPPAGLKITLVQLTYIREMTLKVRNQAFWQQCQAVFPPFAIANAEFPPLGIKVFHAQPKSFHQAQPTAV